MDSAASSFTSTGTLQADASFTGSKDSIKSVTEEEAKKLGVLSSSQCHCRGLPLAILLWEDATAFKRLIETIAIADKKKDGSPHVFVFGRILNKINSRAL